MTRKLTYSILQQQVREALEFTICYSVRKLRPSYTGYCMRVRRHLDNAEQDIGFVGSHLDTVSLMSFVGAQNGYVSIWYNQGIDGSDYDVINTNASNQPQIVRWGLLLEQEGRPTVVFYGSQSLITKDTPLVYLGTPISIFAVAYCEKTGNDANLGINWCRLIGNYSDCYWFFGRYYDKTLQSMFGDSTQWQFAGSTSGDGCTMFANSELSWHRVRMLATTMEDGTDNYLYCNGLFVSKTTNLEMASFTGKFSVGGSYTEAYSQAWIGNIQEVIIYRGHRLELRQAIENYADSYFNFPGYKEYFPTPGPEPPEQVTYSIYSVRQLNFDSTFDGNCMRVRRSTDNTYQNIGFDSNGDLDVASLLDFCGSGDGFVSIWYDQTNRANHLIQSTDSLQPQIVSKGFVLKINDRPAVTMDGSTYLVASSNYIYTQPTSHFLVAQMHKMTQYTHYIDGGSRQVIGYASPNSIIYTNALVNGSKKYPRADKIYALFDGSNSEFFDIDTIVTGNPGSINLRASVVMKQVTGAISEWLVYGNEDKSADRDTVLADMDDYYSINEPVTPLLNIWSVRLVNSNYNGPCIRVRRSADDKEMCIGFKDGVLDVDHLEAFCGSGDGFVVVWYNQNLNGESFVQGAKASQPQIVSSGNVCLENGKPALVADGSTAMSLERPYIIQSQPDTIFMVARTSTVSNDKHYIDGGRQLIGTAGGKLCIYGGSSVVYFGTKGTTQELLYALFNGSSSAIGRNGATAVTGNAGSNSSYPGIFNNITGSIQEIIMYPSDQSANRSTIESDINGFYSIY